MNRSAAWLLALVAFAVSAACGGDEGLIETNDSLNPPAPVARNDAGAASSGARPGSSSSSGSPNASSSSSSSSSSSGDSGPAPVTCPSTASVGPLAPVPGLPATAREPSFTSNELSAYFVQPSGGLSRVFAAARASRSEPFGGMVELGPGVNSGGNIVHVFVQADGLELYFSREEGGGRNVYVARRTATGQAFGPAELFRGNATNELVTNDASARFFARRDGDYWPLKIVRPASADESNLKGLGSQQLADGWIVASVFPSWFEPASSTLWFTSHEVRFGGFGGLQHRDGLRTSQWDPASDSWSTPVGTDLKIVWISPDGCRMYAVNDSGVLVRERVATP